MNTHTVDELHQAILDAELDEEESGDLLKVVIGMNNEIITLDQLKAMTAQLEAGAIGRAEWLRNLASSIPIIH